MPPGEKRIADAYQHISRLHIKEDTEVVCVDAMHLNWGQERMKQEESRTDEGVHQQMKESD